MKMLLRRSIIWYLRGLMMMLGVVVMEVIGHGRLVEPPSRASMWRYGYGTPVDYHDNQLFCGGFTVQWVMNGGRCGVCGDAWSDGSVGPRDHEVGGKYYRGIVVRRYVPGQLVLVIVQLTAAHRGYFEFRLCPDTSDVEEVTQECLDRHLLTLDDGRRTRYVLEEAAGPTSLHQVMVRLPQHLTCDRCLLQWKYHSGNSWGMDEERGRSCLGCGPQEEFYGCSDISINHPTNLPHLPPSHPHLHLSSQHHLQHQPQYISASDHPSAVPLTPTTEVDDPWFPFGQMEDLTFSRQLIDAISEAETRRRVTFSTSNGAKTSSRDDEAVVVARNNYNRSSSPTSSSHGRPVSDPPSNTDSQVIWAEVDFDGQRRNVSVIARRHQMTSLPVSVDRLDLVPLQQGSRGLVFVLPRWYMFEDRATKRITLVEPEVIRWKTLKRMSGKKNGDSDLKNRDRGFQTRSRGWNDAGIIKSDEGLGGEELPIRGDRLREGETGRESDSVGDSSSSSTANTSLTSVSSSPPLSSISSSPSVTSSLTSPFSGDSSSSLSSPSLASSQYPSAVYSEETATRSSSVKDGEDEVPVGREERGSANVDLPRPSRSEGGWAQMERTTVQPNVLHRILWIGQKQQQ